MKEYPVQGGYLQYQIQGRHVEIVGAAALLDKVQIPETIEDLPVTVVDKKAFLSKKYLQKVWLPETIERVGDWAFAYCDRLEHIFVGSRETYFGKAVFLDCGKLQEIHVPETTEDVAPLLASAVRLLESNYLLNPREAGSEDWYAKWDAKMQELLETPDEEGYSKQVLCGEEDYGSVDFEAFTRRKRMHKVDMIFTRLLYPEGLDVSLQFTIEDYLRTHTKGCATEETWLVLKQDHAADARYFKLFANLGCLTKENHQAILEDIGEDSPEMKAYFLGYFDNSGVTSFFDSLFL